MGELGVGGVNDTAERMVGAAGKGGAGAAEEEESVSHPAPRLDEAIAGSLLDRARASFLARPPPLGGSMLACPRASTTALERGP